MYDYTRPHLMRSSLTLPLSDGRGSICCTRLWRGLVMPKGREGGVQYKRLWACEYYPGVFIVLKHDGGRVFKSVRAGCLGVYIYD